MASPQKENGYTAIANELLEALAGIRISGEARQCLDVIIRKTYGFNKKEDPIALSQFCLITKMGKAKICRAISKLNTMNMVITKKGNGTGNIYRFNKDFDTWKPLPKKVTVTKKGNDDYQKREFSLPKKGHTKEKKETITKETIALQATPFNWENYLKGMENHKRRDLQVIAFYFREKKIKFNTLAEAQVAVKRHLRAAKDLSVFDDKKISWAMNEIKSSKDFKDIFTIETLVKLVTK